MDVVPGRPQTIAYMQMLKDVLNGHARRICRSGIYSDTGRGIAIDLEAFHLGICKRAHAKHGAVRGSHPAQDRCVFSRTDEVQVAVSEVHCRADSISCGAEQNRTTIYSRSIYGGIDCLGVVCSTVTLRSVVSHVKNLTACVLHRNGIASAGRRSLRECNGGYKRTEDSRPSQHTSQGWDNRCAPN